MTRVHPSGISVLASASMQFSSASFTSASAVQHTCHGDGALVETSTLAPEHQLCHLVDARVLAVLALVRNSDNAFTGGNHLLHVPGFGHKQVINTSLLETWKRTRAAVRSWILYSGLLLRYYGSIRHTCTKSRTDEDEAGPAPCDQEGQHPLESTESFISYHELFHLSVGQKRLRASSQLHM
jgi:hypothetical protein